MTLTATRVRMLTPVGGGLWPALVTGRIEHIAGSTLGIQSNENAFGIGAGKAIAAARYGEDAVYGVKNGNIVCTLRFLYYLYTRKPKEVR